MGSYCSQIPNAAFGSWYFCKIEVLQRRFESKAKFLTWPSELDFSADGYVTLLGNFSLSNFAFIPNHT